MGHALRSLVLAAWSVVSPLYHLLTGPRKAQIEDRDDEADGTPSMPLQAIEPQRLYQRVAEQLAELIRDGEFDQGRKLPAERELAKMLGVSRPVVREAMVALEIAGLVEVRTGSGTHVTTPVEEGEGDGAATDERLDVGAVLVARALIEGETAALAAEVASPRDLAAIEAAALALRAAIRAEREHREADHAFHTAIVAACGNLVLAGIVEGLWRDSNRPGTGRSARRAPARLAQSLAEHIAILDAIRARDPIAARAAMRAHLDAIRLGS